MKETTRCEVCNNTHLTSVMDLGMHPLPDDLVPIGDTRRCEKYPIEVLYCGNCNMALQRWELPKKQLFFPEYHYRASNTKDVLDGMEQLVQSVETGQGPVKGLKVLDIGCNDGSLLDAFRRRDAVTFGIEPTNAAQEAIARGHCVYQTFFDQDEATRFVARHGHPDIITFTNVFAHIEDLPGLLAALGILRSLNTIIVIENHYLGSVLEKKQFDTFYHEHLRTYSFQSFQQIAKNMDMFIKSVEFPARYGGNIRVMFASTGFNAGVALERSFGADLVKLGTQVGEWRQRKGAALMKEIMHENGHAAPIFAPIPAAAFPTRAAILFGLLGFDERHISAVYEAGSKSPGTTLPGHRIPIFSDKDFPWDTYTGPVVNMAWHIPKEIEANWRRRGFAGKMIQIIDEADFA